MPNTKPTEATLFVRAVLRGVRKGLKLIRRRGRGYPRYYAPEGVLGEYDYTHIRLKLKPAYELYKELSDAPLSSRELCEELRQAGLIESEPSTLTIAGTRCKALIIQRRNCKELNELLLRFSL